MKSITSGLILLLLLNACTKSKNTNDPLSQLDGTWATPAWGGTADDTLTMQISGATEGTGVISSIGSTTWNFSAGETILSNIVPANNGDFTGTGIYKNGSDNSVTNTSDVSIVLSNNNTQMQVTYSATGIVYVYTKQ